MLTFLKDLFTWLFKKLLFLFFPVVGWIVWFFENYSDTWNKAWEWIFSSTKWYLQDFYLWFFSKLTAKLTTFFEGHDFVVNVVEFSDDFFTKMNVIFPMNEACACLTFLVATMVAVFIIRVVLKAIPAVW